MDEDNFIELAESYGLTTIIQPADVTAGRIVEYVRWMQNSAHSSGVETLRMVADGQAEALEFIVRAESQFLDVPLKALKLKDSVLGRLDHPPRQVPRPVRQRRHRARRPRGRRHYQPWYA